MDRLSQKSITGGVAILLSQDLLYGCGFATFATSACCHCREAGMLIANCGGVESDTYPEQVWDN